MNYKIDIQTDQDRWERMTKALAACKEVPAPPPHLLLAASNIEGSGPDKWAVLSIVNECLKRHVAEGAMEIVVSIRMEEK